MFSRKILGSALAAIVVAGCGTAGTSVRPYGASGSSGAPDTAVSTPVTVPITSGTFPPPVNQPPPTTLPKPAITDSPTGASASSLSTSDIHDLVQAFEEWTKFPGNCTLQPVPGTLKAATVTSTGVRWAFGQFVPPTGCTATTRDGRTVDVVSSKYYIATPPLDAGVFEQKSGGKWQVNSFQSNPWPCPDNLSVEYMTPGTGTPYVPLSVLSAVGVPYAPGCEHAYTPPQFR